MTRASAVEYLYFAVMVLILLCVNAYGSNLLSSTMELDALADNDDTDKGSGSTSKSRNPKVLPSIGVRWKSTTEKSAVTAV